MTLQDSYPGAVNAVILCESLKQWEMYRRTAEAEGIASVKARMRESLMAAIIGASGGKRVVLEEALAEWEHPDLDKYFQAKLGAM